MTTLRCDVFSGFCCGVNEMCSGILHSLDW
jgi:hypothetical protein